VQAAPPERVSYTVTVADTTRRRFRVTATAEHVSDATVSFAIPAWSPGWYVLTRAYKNISGVSATDGAGRTLPVTHPDDLTWRVQAGPGGVSRTVTLSYDLAAVDQDPDALEVRTPESKSYGFFAPYLDESHGFVPGPAALVYVDGAKNAPCSVTYKVPAGWSVASANDPKPGDPYTFTASDYDTLADQPADLGKFARWDRTVRGVPVSVVIVGGENIDPKKWVERTFQVAEAGLRFWGKAPFPRYIFHCRFPAGILGGGGLEHENSTVITLPPSDLRQADADDMGLIAHEYFHAWNVKAIRPASLGPFDYSRPVRVSDLWWLEGVTDYFAPRLVVDAGLAGPDYWRAFMASQIADLQNNPARKTVTLETASLKAWEGKSEGFGGLSYYNKGLVVGLLLDIEMRRRTENRVGLTDLTKALYARMEESGGEGYPPGEIERMASKLTGADLKPFFDRALRSTEELPYADILPHAGLTLQDDAARPWYGIRFAPAPPSAGVVVVDGVEEDSPAEAAGLRAGDRIVAAGGQILRGASAFPYPEKVGDSVSLTVRRGGRTRTVTLVAAARGGTHEYRLVTVATRTPLQSAILSSIGGPAAGGSVAASLAPAP
jgi:predicted metalloprotease with PDZ domain